jgi:hypothetical protein
MKATKIIVSILALFGIVYSVIFGDTFECFFGTSAMVLLWLVGVKVLLPMAK